MEADPACKVTSIKLTINGQTLALTPNECRKLYQELSDLLYGGPKFPYVPIEQAILLDPQREPWPNHWWLESSGFYPTKGCTGTYSLIINI